MISSGNVLRFTPHEVDDYSKVGVDVSGVKSQAHLQGRIEDWAQALSEEQPALLEKIAFEMARLKGVKLPPKLAVVTLSENYPQQS